jgi:pimeloyl-ACP methyl ester carboxylesterase
MPNLSFEIEGHAAQPALLLLHGVMSSNLQWAPNRDALREHFRLVAVELWGHGKSPAPRDPGCYRVARYLAELERIREEIGVARWLVCGQSFGAGIAIRYALAHPQAVRGLVVTNSRSALNDVSREAEEGGGLEAFEALDPRRLPFHPCHARRFPADLKARMEAAADAIPRYALWQAGTTTARELSCRRDAAGLSVPTLLVNGRHERVFQADRDFAAATIPDIEIVDLDAGHSVNIEAAEAFDAAVIAFAKRHP